MEFDDEEVRILILNAGEHKESTLYRIQIGWSIHFMLGPTLASKTVTIFCNHPEAGLSPFSRRSFHQLDWFNNTANNGDRSDAFALVKICKPGSFQYHFSVGGEVSGSGFFVVDPILRVGNDECVLPMDSVCMHTVLPKSLGRFSDWMGRLRVSYECGYNVIHLTPVQKLGISNSSYSIADQLELNPAFSEGEVLSISWADIEAFVKSMKHEWRMLTMTDVVWNHTAKNSEWLWDHPECAFNMVNSPHLRPAYVLDRAIFYLTLDVGSGKYVKQGVPRKISSENHLRALEKILLEEVIPKIKLWEFFQVDVDATVGMFVESAQKTCPVADAVENDSKKTISIIQDPGFRRLQSTVDMSVAMHQFYPNKVKTTLKNACENLKKTLLWLNLVKKEQVDKDMKYAVKNVISTIRYERLDDSGPKKEQISKKSPLVTEYFYHNFPDSNLANDETYMDDPERGQHIMAHNGWVMGADPMVNFAEYPTKTYFCRELVSWGDCVKLNYGVSAEDCPVLWQRMKKYTQLIATVFHGIRIDNCHSTPIHVAQYMLDAARVIRPDLYVFAELFTGSEAADNVFVNKLGINSLIREGLMAWDSHELGRLVYRYGGEPVASFVQPKTRPLVPSMAHALLYDVTHDNESAIVKRTVLDSLPSSALVSMASCAVGSNRGHDELVPHHIHVVKEKRLYSSWQDQGTTELEAVTGRRSGIVEARRILNLLHQTMAINGFNQVFVDQRDVDVVVVTRHNPLTHQSYVLVAHTAFKNTELREVNPLVIEGHIESIAYEARPESNNVKDILSSFTQHSDIINGLSGFNILSDTDIPLKLSNCCVIESDVQNVKARKITFKDFPPGSVVIFRVKLTPEADSDAQKVRGLVDKLLSDSEPEFKEILSSLDLRAMNRVLFRCDEEERSDGLGIGAYNFMGWDSLKYCGIQGIMSVMAVIRANNDLGHPVCNNLREGNWLMEYIASRLQKHEATRRLGDWYKSAFRPFHGIPRYLIPAYLDMVMEVTYLKLLDRCWNQMSPFIRDGTRFVKSLALGTVTLCGNVKHSGLPAIQKDKVDFPSLAAGLPHFSTGIMRCWGRDTFIALRGLILIPGRYEEAKNMVLGFAGCVRHGLIPNLLGEGKICRYNCRDAVWWWLQCIQDICETCPDGYDFLKADVGRIYPTDESEPILPPQMYQPLYDVIQDCLQRHVDGIHYRERGAGTAIDRNMSEAGFNVEAGVNLNNGFVYGGSKFNCGTWMDKMGESGKAKNKGVPATPRDGAAVELVGLCKSTVRWLQKASNSGNYPYDCVFMGDSNARMKLPWHEWNKKIQDNFEQAFFISEDDASSLVHKRGIYKDSLGASQAWCDYQLRPNFPIAMVVAPELFDVQHAWQALEIAQKKLLGPLGMKTLDPDDMKYRGDYDNSNDGNDFSIAKGFNYHQGPEWLWPVGFFWRAKLIFANQLGEETLKKTEDLVRGYLSTHQLHVEKSMWKGLPELTNSNGAWCRDSCEIQAWSNATIIELLYDLHKYDV